MKSSVEKTRKNLTPCAESLADPITAANYLFSTMNAIFPKQWLDSFNTLEEVEFAKRIWGAELAKYKIEYIDKAIQDVIHSGERFPPSLPVFMKYVETAKERKEPKGYKVFRRG